MQVTILGCGTSTGVPLIHCECEVCLSSDPRNNRLRASIFITLNGKNFLIDTSTDLRQQAIRSKMKRIDAILFTHPHADHISGIDEIRSFNFIQKSRIPAYGNDWVCRELPNRYPYIFKNEGKNEGGGIAGIDLYHLDSKAEEIFILNEKMIPLPAMHGSEECLGFRFDQFAYLTDCHFIPDSTKKRLMNLDVFVIDCLRIAPHPTHFNLEQTLSIIEELKPKKAILTHLSHDFDYETWNRKGTHQKLPDNVFIAYDGLTFEL